MILMMRQAPPPWLTGDTGKTDNKFLMSSCRFIMTCSFRSLSSLRVESIWIVYTSRTVFLVLSNCSLAALILRSLRLFSSLLVETASTSASRKTLESRFTCDYLTFLILFFELLDLVLECLNTNLQHLCSHQCFIFLFPFIQLRLNTAAKLCVPAFQLICPFL